MFMRSVEKPQLLRADEGPWRARVQPHRPCRGEPRRTHARKTTSSSSTAWACASATRPTAGPWTPEEERAARQTAASREPGQCGRRGAEQRGRPPGRLDKDASSRCRPRQGGEAEAGGKTLRDLARGIVQALNIDATRDMPPAEADQRLRERNQAVQAACRNPHCASSY